MQRHLKAGEQEDVLWFKRNEGIVWSCVEQVDYTRGSQKSWVHRGVRTQEARSRRTWTAERGQVKGGHTSRFSQMIALGALTFRTANVVV